MIRRKLNTEKCGCCCTLKEKLQYLWDHTMGAILKVNDITPDGDGKFTIEAGSNIALTEISNGLRIDTTGGVSYYSAGDSYIDVDNNDLEISLVDPGQSGGVALHDDLEVVATGLTNLLNGGNVGSDTKPIKIVNGVATPVANDLQTKLISADVSYAPGSSVTVGIGSTLKRYGDDLIIGRFLGTTVATGTHTFIQGLPRSLHHQRVPLFSESLGWIGTVVISENSTAMTYNATTTVTDAYVDFEYLILS